MTLPASDFFKKAWRMGAYAGVMQARLADQESAPAPAGSAAFGGSPSSAGREINPGTRTTLQADPVFAGIFSFESM